MAGGAQQQVERSNRWSAATGGAQQQVERSNRWSTAVGRAQQVERNRVKSSKSSFLRLARQKSGTIFRVSL